MSDRLTLLYADDDLGDDPATCRSCKALAWAFAQLDKTVTMDIARTGADTWRKLREKRYDALILDIMMPQGEEDPANPVPQAILDADFLVVGLALAKELIKLDSEVQPTKVLVYTASPLRETIQAMEEIVAKQNGRWILLGKPCLNSELAEWIIGGNSCE